MLVLLRMTTLVTALAKMAVVRLFEIAVVMVAVVMVMLEKFQYR